MHLHPLSPILIPTNDSTISRDTLGDDVMGEDHHTTTDKTPNHKTKSVSSVTFHSATKKWNEGPTRRFLTVEKGLSVNS